MKSGSWLSTRPLCLAPGRARRSGRQAASTTLPLRRDGWRLRKQEPSAYKTRTSARQLAGCRQPPWASPTVRIAGLSLPPPALKHPPFPAPDHPRKAGVVGSNPTVGLLEVPAKRRFSAAADVRSHSSGGHDGRSAPHRVMSNQRRNVRDDRDLQDGGDILGPRLHGGVLNPAEGFDPDGVAPVPLRDRYEIKTGKIETGYRGRLLELGERFEDPVLLVSHNDDQHGEPQLRRVPDRLDRVLERPVPDHRDDWPVPARDALGKRDPD